VSCRTLVTDQFVPRSLFNLSLSFQVKCRGNSLHPFYITITTISNTIEDKMQTIKERSRSKDEKRKKKSKKGDATDQENRRLVPATHVNRPYFDVPNTARRNGTPIYHSESLNYSRAGIGVVFRDADSSARALQELAQKKQERTERKRAGLLLGLLIFMASSVHFMTRPKAAIIPTQSASPGGGKDIDYGENKGGVDVEGVRSDGVQNATKRDSILDHFTDSLEDFQKTFTPFFFHVPRSGGQTVKDIVSLCLNKVQANEVGVRNGHQTDTQLQIVAIDNTRYVNVDTSSKEGIERAAMMGFAQTQMAEIVTSSYFLNAARFLFSEDRPGRAFIMMRNPLHRAVSMYYYQRSNGELDEKLSLEEFARGAGIENNWMTRFLTNAMEGELKKSHLDQAKKILGKKFLVGFLDDSEESISRVIKYNGWKYDDDETKALMQQDCVSKKLTDGSNKNPVEYELPKKGSQAHALISWQTQFDMKLYGKDTNRHLFRR
jgi:hypothetical protein